MESNSLLQNVKKSDVTFSDSRGPKQECNTDISKKGIEPITEIESRLGHLSRTLEESSLEEIKTIKEHLIQHVKQGGYIEPDEALILIVYFFDLHIHAKEHKTMREELLAW
ncbi:hypothetical protein [Paenibacillus oryzisoli]|uniref:Uncharacterized protein n=1 Tax=Paenibacillus oryzisoli TaxID=1850517 RepID=A0A198A8P1_9BACL|nr:hypothetical protein [Paenibacillus oryzisoli]OAS17470.1 hypothetical protein A8708_22150 [Paenibacillus oryzisoli]